MMVLIYKLFALSVLLFAVGVILARIVVKKKIDFLIRIPIGLLKFATGFIEKHPSLMMIFLFIFLFNSANAALYFFSGWIPVLPVVFNIWLGMNIGIVFMTPPELKQDFLKEHPAPGEEEDVGRGIFILLSSFVFIAIELFSVFYAISLSHEINLIIMKGLEFGPPQINEYMVSFAKYSLTGLFIAAFIEAYIIKDNV